MPGPTLVEQEPYRTILDCRSLFKPGKMSGCNAVQNLDFWSSRRQLRISDDFTLVDQQHVRSGDVFEQGARGTIRQRNRSCARMNRQPAVTRGENRLRRLGLEWGL
jgi:hypothetical protein